MSTEHVRKTLTAYKVVEPNLYKRHNPENVRSQILHIDEVQKMLADDPDVTAALKDIQKKWESLLKSPFSWSEFKQRMNIQHPLHTTVYDVETAKLHLDRVFAALKALKTEENVPNKHFGQLKGWINGWKSKIRALEMDFDQDVGAKKTPAAELARKNAKREADRKRRQEMRGR